MSNEQRGNIACTIDLQGTCTLCGNTLGESQCPQWSNEDVKLIFEEDVLDFIVNKAMEYKLGARGLRSICEAIMLDAMYDTPSDDTVKELHITLDYAIEKFEKADFKKLKAA